MLDADNPAETVEPSAPAEDDTGAGDTATAPPVPQAETPTGDGSANGAAAAADEAATGAGPAPAKKAAAKRTAAKKTTAKKATAKKTAAKRATKKTAEPGAAGVGEAADAAERGPGEGGAVGDTPLEASSDAAPEAARAETPQREDGDAAPAAKKAPKKAAKKAPAKRAAKKPAAAEETEQGPAEATPAASASEAPAEEGAGAEGHAPVPATALLFQPPDPTKAVVTRRRRATRPEAPAAADTGDAVGETVEGEETRKPAKKAGKKPGKAKAPEPSETETPGEEAEAGEETGRGEGEEDQGGERRRRRRGGRRRRRSGSDENGAAEAEGDGGTGEEVAEKAAEAEETEEAGATGSRRRRRRRRAGESGEGSGEEPEGTVTRVRKPRNAEDEITAVTGSTRLEAKKQRRREGREAGRRRAPIVSEAEFLARRESVDRVMVIRQRQDLTQIAVLEDKVLVEHYVARESQTSLIGNVYLGRVQNVLPSMEAAFIDIGKGRNAVLYAGEVNWDALGAKNGSPRKIEAVLKSGQTVLVQVTKDPVGHKGARLTSQISLPGRFLVYVPDGTTSGISRKLPDTERSRLKSVLKEIVPDTAGVIVRTAAEGASEEELTRDVERLTARWADIEKKAGTGNAPQLLYGEPDLTLKVVRDLFTEDFKKLVISGGDAWDMVDGYVSHVAPDLADRLERYDGERDVFAEYRIDEQIEKALDRKVWLPSGGSLVIDRTEAMTVVDVNTGKFTGSGGNLEETVTKNNLEAAEEIVRQLRLRDIGGIIVVDFIDMVLESNRDLVLRRLVECLGRDRTRHQVAEVTSLGLVQMTRKRIGTGLLEAFSESCEHCQGRGLVTHHEPVEPKKKGDDDSRRGRRGGRGRGRDESAAGQAGGVPSPKDIAAMAKHEEKAEEKAEEKPRESARETTEARVAESVPASTGSTPAETEVASDGEQPRRGRGGRGRGGRGRGREEVAASVPETGPEQSELFPAPEESEQQPAGGPEELPGEAAGQRTPEEVTRPTAEPSDERGPARADSKAGRKGAEEAPAETGPAEPAEPAAPAAPKIVTSVRRRGARRPAGPPAAAAGQGPSSAAPPVSMNGPADDAGTDEPADVDPIATLVDAAEAVPSVDGESDGVVADAPATPHVPVKKRGSRRR